MKMEALSRKFVKLQFDIHLAQCNPYLLMSISVLHGVNFKRPPSDEIIAFIAVCVCLLTHPLRYTSESKATGPVCRYWRCFKSSLHATADRSAPAVLQLIAQSLCLSMLSHNLVICLSTVCALQEVSRWIRLPKSREESKLWLHQF